jgi:hypothetical protein
MVKHMRVLCAHTPGIDGERERESKGEREREREEVHQLRDTMSPAPRKERKHKCMLKYPYEGINCKWR